MLTTFNDFERIVTEEIPLIDVRSPIEFEKGSFINSINLPLMNDEERHLVGICYKEKGQAEAIKLGHSLVTGEKRDARIDAWSSFVNSHPNSLLFCFRGGLRSQISQEWISNHTGKEIPRLLGGYKEFRNYLINAFEPQELNSTPIRLGGCTGSGKTKLLKKIENSIDLEGIANHRGSSFGRYLTPQPMQINFENNLAYAVIQHKSYRYLILEDEGLNIGKNIIPKSFYTYFTSGDIVILDVSFEERIENTLNEYVVESQADYIKQFGRENGLLEWYNYISSSIERLKTRLGGECLKRVMESLQLAHNEQLKTGSFNMHKNWIEIILKEYYDPMYNYQMTKSTNKILFKGNTEEVIDFLRFYNLKF
ncbi:MAG: selU [Haloplasmataceae bacterium]|nr:selU [Haloplasmataceae bacterium]